MIYPVDSAIQLLNNCGPGSNSGVKVFLRVLRFSSLVENQHFQIPNRPGIEELLSRCATFKALFIYLFYLLIDWLIKLYCNSGLVFWMLGEKWGEQALPITWDRHWWHFQVHASTEKEEVSTIQRRRQHHQLTTFLFVFWSFLHVLVALIFIYSF